MGGLLETGNRLSRVIRCACSCFICFFKQIERRTSYRANIPCLSLWERWPSAARTERVSKGARLSPSPAVTALPKGEPRACTPLHSMKMERIGADTLHELFSTIRQLDGTPLSLIQTSAAYGRRFPVSWPAEPSDPQRSPAFSGGRAAAPPDGTAPSSACRCGRRTGRAPAKF